jgi:glutathione peroxidase
VTFQYRQLNALQDEFSPSQQFTVIGIPSNQFGYQEPAETKAELLNGLKYVRPGDNFEPNFPLFWLVDVNGKNQHPLFEYLKSSVPPTKKLFEDHTMIFYNPRHSDDIRWNFEKFLIDSHGHPIMRFDSDAEPAFIRQFIERLFQLQKYL